MRTPRAHDASMVASPVRLPFHRRLLLAGGRPRGVAAAASVSGCMLLPGRIKG